MLQVSLAAFAVSGTFLGLAYFDLFYHLVVIMVLTGAIVKEALSMEKWETGRERMLDQAAQHNPR